tara:strand:- start:187 stop:1023 length:837 start_codon:yes stop_codon:yes gene_type:complete
MKHIYDNISQECSKNTTQTYSTSFSLGIKALNKELHQPIYNIYGFVRLADEIVDTFHDYNKLELLSRFKQDAINAIEDKISLNPILNSFQETVNRYQIDWSLIEAFLNSMEMDLEEQVYDKEKYQLYILGSAEVVGLMCLRVFVQGNDDDYNKLKPFAMKLGSAFQKVNFLRDANSDFQGLGRTYFPDVNMFDFTEAEKRKIENDIEDDFKTALTGIKMLPYSSKGGVYLAYRYYYDLFSKIKSLPSSRILKDRIRIPNSMKIVLLVKSILRHQLKLI